MYKASKVPVGKDQVPHLELTREIVRRFNHLYGNVFPEPEQILTEMSKVLGIDRRKMSKSYDNAIYLSESPEGIKDKVSQMITDPQRKREEKIREILTFVMFLPFIPSTAPKIKSVWSMKSVERQVLDVWSVKG